MFSLQTVACKKDPPPHWSHIAVSVNGRLATLIDREGYLWAGTSDFRVCLYTYEIIMTVNGNECCTVYGYSVC